MPTGDQSGMDLGVPSGIPKGGTLEISLFLQKIFQGLVHEFLKRFHPGISGIHSDVSSEIPSGIYSGYFQDIFRIFSSDISPEVFFLDLSRIFFKDSYKRIKKYLQENSRNLPEVSLGIPSKHSPEFLHIFSDSSRSFLGISPGVFSKVFLGRFRDASRNYIRDRNYFRNFFRSFIRNRYRIFFRDFSRGSSKNFFFFWTIIIVRHISRISLKDLSLCFYKKSSRISSFRGFFLEILQRSLQ